MDSFAFVYVLPRLQTVLNLHLVLTARGAVFGPGVIFLHVCVLIAFYCLCLVIVVVFMLMFSCLQDSLMSGFALDEPESAAGASV